MKSANLELKHKSWGAGMDGIEACTQKWTSKGEREQQPSTAAAARGESSGEVGKSVKRWSWEGELVTSSGVDFTAPVALILTSRPPLGRLHLQPPQLLSLWRGDFITPLKMSRRGCERIYLINDDEEEDAASSRWLGLSVFPSQPHIYTVFVCFLGGIQINIPTPGAFRRSQK